MNGRAYDYNLGRFYGVDPVIQFPTNSQSLNGYSYLMNNPLSGTDPTGYMGSSVCDRVSVDCGAVEGGLSTNDRNIATADAAGRSAQNQLAAKWNGAPQVQGPLQNSRTDKASTPSSLLSKATPYVLPMSQANGERGKSGSWSDVGGALYTKSKVNQRGQFFPLFPSVLNHMMADAVLGPLEIPDEQLPTLAAIEFAEAVVGAAIPMRAVGLGRATGAVGRVAEDIKGPSAGSIRNVNPSGAIENCVNCAIATDSVLAGRPAIAQASGPQSIGVLEKLFGNRFSSNRTVAELTAQMTRAGPGARGIVFGSRGEEVGHVFNIVNQNGVVRFLDGQTARAASLEGFKSFQLLRTN